MSLKATVIGTVFIDCKGFARDIYIPTGRNLGSIRFVHGGVGRNVAENLARMGVPTRFVSSVDATGLGQEVIERLRRTNADTQYVGAAEREGMGMWLAVLDHAGDLAGSISQMPDLGTMERIVAEHGDTIVRESSHLLLELDLNATISKRVLELAEKHGKPVYGIPGNLEVVLGHPELMRSLSCFICNHVEAERLLGVPVHELDEAAQKEAMLAYLQRSGLRSLVVTLGADGSVYASADTGEFGRQTVFPVNVQDTSGAGDAFFSGAAMGLMRGLPLRDAVVCGTKVAGWTIESPENNCERLGELLAQDEAIRALLPDSV
ncbi:carbohydrate kinase family protein [Paenibacillus flagellatus]|uniref:Sugar kinase n=1 Tax=Paenibacillus flagellatus TaxID=2211139 RepID=A0A2V5JVN7_9BACL|nr:PfkB family carbohydrate kinase [Paenibacillus flagellatus]PYI50805.1 sugar kinase [Paenibacillus flagellatus]